MILFCSLMTICTICALLSFFKNRADKSYPKLWWPASVFPFIVFAIAILFQGPSHGPDAMAGMKYIPLLPFIAVWILVSVISLFRFPKDFDLNNTGCLGAILITFVGTAIFSALIVIFSDTLFELYFRSRNFGR